MAKKTEKASKNKGVKAASSKSTPSKRSGEKAETKKGRGTKTSSRKAETEKNANSKASLPVKAMTFNVFGDELTVPVERVEYTLLSKRFSALADEVLVLAAKTIDGAAKDIDDFCENGDDWAHQYIDRAADLAIEVLINKKIYSIDRDTFIQKYLNAYLWEESFKVVCEGVAEIDAEEEEREAGRQERYAEAGNWVGFSQESSSRARSKNFEEKFNQGTLNLIGRGFHALVNASSKKSLFKDNRDEMLNGIYLTVKTSVDELVDCLEDNGYPFKGAKVDEKAEEMSGRLLNNIKTGKLPKAAEHDAKMQILKLNPFDSDFYGTIYLKEGDKSGELCEVAEFFGISLDELKMDAFIKQLGKCSYKTEAETIEYRKRAVQLGNELYVDPIDKIKEIDKKLNEFDEAARTVDNKLFDTREEAALQRELSSFEKKLDLSTEESALKAKKALDEKAKKLGVDGAWKMKRVDNALKKFDEKARTTFGVLLKTRKEAMKALGDRELFYKGIVVTIKATDEDAFYTGDDIPEKKIANARACFPIPVEEFVLALTDTTLFGSGKTGLAITKWGLRWANGGSHRTNVTAMSWEEFANEPAPPANDDNDFTLTTGGVYANAGSGVDEDTMKDVLTALHEYCHDASFLITKSADEMAAEEAELPFMVRMDKLLKSITDSGFLVGGNIPAKKIAGATKSCQVDSDDKILALIDSTFFGSAATALVISEKGVYWHNKESRGKCFIPWNKMASFKKKMKVTDDNRLLFSQGNGFKAGMASVDLDKVKNVIVKIGDIAVSAFA